MGMPIDEHIKRMGDIRSNYDRWSVLGLTPNEAKAFDLAIETMRKYQKIVQIMERTVDDGTSMYDTLQEIEEVIYGNEVIEE